MNNYTTKGNVRGYCGHKHRDIYTAYDCLERDRAGCKAQGGYSDRKVVRIDEEDLTEKEKDQLFDMDLR